MGSVLIVDRDRWRSKRFRKALEASGLRADTACGMEGGRSFDLVFVASRIPGSSARFMPEARKDSAVIGMFMGAEKEGGSFDTVVRTFGELKFFIDSMRYLAPDRAAHGDLGCREGGQ